MRNLPIAIVFAVLFGLLLSNEAQPRVVRTRHVRTDLRPEVFQPTVESPVVDPSIFYSAEEYQAWLAEYRVWRTQTQPHCRQQTYRRGWDFPVLRVLTFPARRWIAWRRGCC
jgi:hypothetical protein